MNDDTVSYISNFIALIVIASLVFGAIQFKKTDAYQVFNNQVRKLFQPIGDFFRTRKENIAIEVAPSRKAPFTFIEQEETLRIYIPEIFSKFSPRDWKHFWALIYEPVKEKKGLFAKKRYRSKQEVEEYLIKRFPSPFSYFKPVHWQEFWTIAKVKWDNE
jgi:hypothetical protein